MGNTSHLERRYKSQMHKVAGLSPEEPGDHFIVVIPEHNCKWADAQQRYNNTRTCCIYTYDHNVYVCPYSGEEVLLDNPSEEEGPCVSYCTYPTKADHSI